MKKTVQLLTLFLLTALGLAAIEIHWQATLPIGESSAVVAGAGSDGSAVVLDSSTDTIYWFDINGNTIGTITNFTGATGNFPTAEPMIVSSSELVFLGFNPRRLIIATKTDSEPGYSIVTLNEEPGLIATRPSFPFLVTQDDIQLNMYKLDSISSLSSAGVTTVPANAVVIPASHQGDVTISLESSVDLVEWNNVLPGPYSTSEDGARFFRVKVVTAN